MSSNVQHSCILAPGLITTMDITQDWKQDTFFGFGKNSVYKHFQSPHYV